MGSPWAVGQLQVYELKPLLSNNKDKWGLALDGRLKHKITFANYKFYPSR